MQQPTSPRFDIRSARPRGCMAALVCALLGCGDDATVPDASADVDAAITDAASVDAPSADAAVAPSCLGDVWPIRQQDVGHWHLDGPPMVAQVFALERTEAGVQRQLAFGDHPAIPTDPESPEFDDRVVTAAVADATQEITVVLSEPVPGNYLEWVACNDGTFGPVPLGTTAEDITNCSPPDLAGCTQVCPGVGILDLDSNGVADDFSMADYEGNLAIDIVCDETSVELDRHASSYRVQGSQESLEQLGPVIVLRPSTGLPAGSRCTLMFEPAIVDCDGGRVCAPPGGDFANAECPAPGDTSLIQFDVESEAP